MRHADGQKIWTTFGHHADWLYVLRRTNPDLSLRHKGLTMLLIDADQPGVDIRPIENINRSTEFSECFFSDAQTPEDMVVGAVGGGWSVVMTTLGMERGSALMPMQRRCNANSTASSAWPNAVARPMIRRSAADWWTPTSESG